VAGMSNGFITTSRAPCPRMVVPPGTTHRREASGAHGSAATPSCRGNATTIPAPTGAPKYSTVEAAGALSAGTSTYAADRGATSAGVSTLLPPAPTVVTRSVAAR
jgi:hypothetical protein